jgi:hypothetical protein
VTRREEVFDHEPEKIEPEKIQADASVHKSQSGFS